MVASTVDTGKISGRRVLHFNSMDELTADVDRLVAAERAGRLRRLGNWTLGQTLGHLATWMDFAFTGSPLNPPWIIKMIIRLKKKQFFQGPMPAGVKIPGVEGGTVGTADVPLDEALPHFRKAADRLKNEAPALPHNIFGKLPHDQFIAMNLRHAELHLGFFIPATD